MSAEEMLETLAIDAEADECVSAPSIVALDHKEGKKEKSSTFLFRPLKVSLPLRSGNTGLRCSWGI